METASPSGAAWAKESRSWPRALGLLIVACTPLVQPTVLLAIPYLALALVLGVRRLRVLVVPLVALFLVFLIFAFWIFLRGFGWHPERAWGLVLHVPGSPHGAGLYLDLAWALLLGGCFAALTVRRPQSAFSGRALGAVASAAGLTALMLAVRPGAWGAVQWLVQDRMTRWATTYVEALRILQGGRGVPQALVTSIYEAVDKQILVLPAMIGLASFAALGVAWWLYVRLATDRGGALQPLKSFRFNDHLVWVLIGGVVLLVLRAGGLTRLGANAVVFMGVLYAVRGAAVVLFLAGRLSVFVYLLLVVGVFFLPPLVITGAEVTALIGIGDTWLDVRKRVTEARARHNDS